MTNTNTNIQSLTASEILSNFFKGKGQFMRVAWKSNEKPAASYKDVVLEKRTTTIVRSGVEFKNLSSVKAGIESGERGEVQELPWGEWVQYPHLIKHKDSYYCRVYPTDSIPVVKYLASGEEVDKEKYASYLTPSSAQKLLGEKEKPECFTIKMENIISTEEVIN